MSMPSPDTLAVSHQSGDSRAAKRRLVVVQNHAGAPRPAHDPRRGSSYDLWVKGELHEVIGVPDDGRTRVEIIGGEIVMSPGPLFQHARIATDIHNAIARAGSPEFPWRAVQGMDFNLERINDGYIPDLVVMSAVEFDVADGDARHLTVRQISMVVEITSKSTAADDREPGPRRERPTKWNGYAREQVPFYLLVDRDPRIAKTTLFTKPDPVTGAYRTSRAWAFGVTVVLPDPFGVEIATDFWDPWHE
jgi:Uma2 family endonuclease